MSDSDVERHLRDWMNKDGGPGLRQVLDALARICLSVAAKRREHVLFSAEAEHVWTPTADRLIDVKRFIESQFAAHCPNRKIPEQ